MKWWDWYLPVEQTASLTCHKILIGLKLYLKDLRPFLTPYLRGAPFAWHNFERFRDFQNSECSEILYRFRDILKSKFRCRTNNALKRSFEKKMKTAYCWEHYSMQILFNNAFQNLCRFQDIRVQGWTRLGP